MTKLKNIIIKSIYGADEGIYFETRPIEVILADLAESLDRMQRIRNTIYDDSSINTSAIVN